MVSWYIIDTCLIHNLSECRIPTKVPGNIGYYASKDTKALIARIITKVGESGWIQAVAKVHNRKTHATNGNIDKVDTDFHLTINNYRLVGGGFATRDSV